MAPPYDSGATDKAAPPVDVQTDKPEVAADVPVDVPTLPAITLTLSDATVNVKEGDMKGATFTVSLSRGSATPIALMVTTGDPTVATVDHDTVNFDSNDIGPKTITVFGTEDMDTVDNSTKLTLSAPGVTTASVLVTVKDKDVQAIVPVQSQTTVTENGNGQIGVSLQFDPLGTVTVMLASTDPSRLTLGQATLTFNSKNYFIPQQVTVNALKDDDTINNVVTINLTAVGITASAISVTIIDIDVQNFDSTGSLMLIEAGQAGVISVKLTKKPDANVTVTVTTSDPTRADLGATTLTFTPDNFDTPQAFTVTPKHDTDTKDDQITVTLHSDSVMSDRVIPVSIKDIDSQTLVITPLAGVTLMEGGQAVSVSVSLMFDPGAAVSVNVFSSNTAKVIVDKDTLNFDSTTYKTPQTVFLSGQIDDDIVDDSAKITFNTPGATSVSVPVTVKDKDKQTIVLVAPSAVEGNLAMEEPADGAQPHTVMLGARLGFRPPTGKSVTVTLVSSDESRLSLSKTTPPSTTLVFDETNFNVAQFIIMTPIHDADIMSNVVTVTASSPDVMTPAVLTVTIQDVDTEHFTLPDMVSTTEPAANTTGNSSINVALALAPGRQVPVLLTSKDKARVLFTTPSGPAETTMIYLSDTTPINVPIVVMHDSDAVDNTVVVTVADTSGIITSRTVNVLITDIDKLNYIVNLLGPFDGTPDPVDLAMSHDPTRNRLLVNESAPMNVATFTVALSADPINDVTLSVVALVSNVIVVDPPTLTFNAGTAGGANNWNSPHTVTVTGVHDLNLLDEFPTIRISGLGNGSADPLVYVHQKDVDSQSLIVTASSFTVTDVPGNDNAKTFNVSLAKEPASSVTVNIIVPDSLAQSITVSPPSLVFNAGNYSMPATVTVTGVVDDNLDIEKDQITVSLAAQATATIMVTTTDSDHQGIVVGGDNLVIGNPPCVPDKASCNLSLALKENSEAPDQSNVPGSRQSITVKLAHKPQGGATETIGFKFMDSLKLGESSNLKSLSFSPVKDAVGGWNLPQTITIVSKADTDVNDETATVTFNSDQTSGTQAPAQVINVAIADEDVVGIKVQTSGSTEIDESGTQKLTVNVSLLNQPLADFVVQITNGDPTHATASKTSLTFSTTNFGDSQSFVISGVVDNDSATDHVTFTLQSSSARAGASQQVQVTVDDTVAPSVDAGGDGGSDADGGTDSGG